MKTEKIETGSFRELLKISLPLMISFLSLFVMIFVDRIFLSLYSTSALNAATSAGTFCWSLILGWTTLASLAEVFVAQYNGARQYKMLGIPTWQMMWLGVISLFFFIPIAIWGSGAIYGQTPTSAHEFQYFKWTMFFSPASVFLAALTAFFVGQGKTSVIKWLALLGNIINVILDPIFIFGIKGFVPSMGISGACIATGIGIIVQVVVLFCLFIKKQYREDYGTDQYAFKKSAFIKCIKVGLPPALFVFIELFGWSLFYNMMTKVSASHILVSSICQSILLLFVFFGLGIEKGAAAVAGNLIGANRIEKVRNVLVSGCKMIAIFSLLIVVFFFMFPDFLMSWFFKNPQALESSEMQLGALSTLEFDSLKATIRTCLIFTGVYVIIEYLRWLLNGVLTAAGDTMFLMVSGALCVWFFMLMPTYFFIVKHQAAVEYAIMIWVGYSILAFFVMLFRYRQGKWKKRSLLINNDDSCEDSPAPQEEPLSEE